MTSARLRPARPDDAADCLRIRGLTRENAFSADELAALGITVESWSAGIRDGSLPGYVACAGESDEDDEDPIVGYCFGSAADGEVVVLAVLPEHEGHGLGTALLGRVVDLLGARGFPRLFLSCAADPGVRSYHFYRSRGWTSTGQYDELGDEVLELALSPH